MNAGFFLFMAGLLLTALGAGGVESSISNYELLMATIVAATGLGIMYCGTVMIKEQQ